jgi:hypothetical protein
MVACHVTFQCQLFTPMLLERELGLVPFNMDLPIYFIGEGFLVAIILHSN